MDWRVRKAMKVVIVGNGVAGIEAALEVRATQPSWDISIVSEESDHFFARTSLMYVFTGQLRARDIEPLERDAYTKHRFRRVRARAVGIDVAGKRLLLAGEPSSVPYDRLLIASGSNARPGPWPGSDLGGVGSFVTLGDLGWLTREARADAPTEVDSFTSPAGSPYARRPAAAVEHGRPASRPVVIGGGLIGIEAVEILVAEGLRPRFLIRDEWFWPMALDAREARWIAEHMSAHGVDVTLEAQVQRLEGDARGLVSRVVTENDAYATDLVVVAIGVVPNTAWLGTSVALDEKSRAVIVDEGLATSVPDIYAAGDCAAVRWWDGSMRPEQLWYTARDQGRIAGARLAGKNAKYARGTWYNSAKLFDVEYTTVGLVGASLPLERSFFFEERGAVRSTTRIIASEERFVGANFLGRRWDHSVLREWIDEQRPATWVLDHLREASFDTELVPPLTSPTWAES